MTFTIKELCDYLQAEVPPELVKKQDRTVKGINARYTALEDGDAFFDINNDCEDLTLINPARCLLIISGREIEEGSLKVPVVKIDNALDRYVGLCKLFVDEYPDTIRIAVTGSNGKTSMKETIAAILENVAATDKTFSNQNNIYYLSKRLQEVMPKNLRFYVEEIAAKAYENINLTQKHAEAFQPKFAVMTNIVNNHAEVYGNRETTFKIKSSLVEEMGDSGVALLNMDDEILQNYYPRCQTIYYSLDNPEADIYAGNIKVSNEGTRFDIHWQGRVVHNVFCPMIGEHNVYNCLVAFAIASLNGVDDEFLVRSIAKVKLLYALRQNHIKIGPYNLFIDCFNASLESIESDMKTMMDLSPDAGGRKVVVLGDVAELGEKAEDIHRNIGAAIVRYPVDRYFCFGQYSDCMYEGAMAENPGAPVSAFTDRAEMEAIIKEYLRPGDLILWKASRSTQIELSIDNLFGTDYYPIYPRDYDTEAKVLIYPGTTKKPEAFVQRYYRMGEPLGGLPAKRFQGGEFQYCRYENGIKLAAYTSKCKAAAIPQEIDGVSIRSIGNRAFYNKLITSVSIPDSVVNIAINAFLRCTNLQEVKLSNNIRILDYSAFAICTALEEIRIPESCLLIRNRVFYQCKRLKLVVIEGTGTRLEERVFEGCNGVRIKCRPGSLAEQFAIEHGITYSTSYGLSGENWITPVVADKEIVIHGLSWQDHDGRSRLNVDISLSDEDAPDVLWYEVDSKWRKYVSDDRIDAVVVSLFLFAIRGGYKRIRSELPISEELKYQLTNHLIPQIVDFEGEEKATAVELDAPATNKVYDKPFIANGTGFSRGIDSFATLYEYGRNSDAPEDYKVNFLNVYNVGAFHGRDVGIHSYQTSRELFMEQAGATVEFAEKYGYNALVVDSNLDMFLRGHFAKAQYGRMTLFEQTSSERNIGTSLLFQKLFSRFYFASTLPMKARFELSLDHSSAYWESYAVQFFSTENMRFYIANRDWTRMEKAQRVAELPEAYDNLQVCLVRSGNCGVCMKCKRTLRNLDVLGEEVLNRFAKSFDLEEYKSKHRKQFFDALWTDADTDDYSKEILQAAVKCDSPLIQDPPIQKTGVQYVYKCLNSRISVMRLPTLMSEEIRLLIDPGDRDFTVEGFHRNNWVKVRLADGRPGYIQAKDIACSTP